MRKQNVVIQHFLTITLLLAGTALALSGCVPSEETGAGSGAKSPVQIFGPIDTTRRVVHRTADQDTVSRSNIDSMKIAAVKKPRVAPKFKSQQDTVRASVVTKSKLSSHARNKMKRPEHPVFTVQIGAYNQVSKALQAQKKAKEYFVSQPVFNTFIKRVKLYRVSIGRYENREEAFSLCDSLKQKDPEEYKLCWVNVIP
jgi:septal ring-binding cell division protein DamX